MYHHYLKANRQPPYFLGGVTGSLGGFGVRPPVPIRKGLTFER